MLIDVLGPIAEVSGYLFLSLFWAIGTLNVGFILAFTALFMVFGIFYSVSTLILEEMELRRTPRARSSVARTGAIEGNFGYRQINSVWRIIVGGSCCVNKTTGAPCYVRSLAASKSMRIIGQ